MCSLIPECSSYRVSSVLNRDVKQFGKKYLFDKDEETCWNSDQGTPQFVVLQFNRCVQLQEIHIKFQGGFAGQDCHIEGSNGEAEFTKITDIYPEDNNSLQIFQVSSEEDYTSLKIVFEKSTDFFGRIIIYNLDMIGTVK